MFLEILRNSRKTLKCQNFFWTRLQSFSATTLKRRLRHRCFLVSLTKFLRILKFLSFYVFTGQLRAPISCFLSFSAILIKKAFSMTLKYLNCLSKSFDCCNRYQYIVTWKCKNSFNSITSLTHFQDILKDLLPQ